MYKQDKNKTEPLSLFQLVVGVGKFLEVPFLSLQSRCTDQWSI